MMVKIIRRSVQTGLLGLTLLLPAQAWAGECSAQVGEVNSAMTTVKNTANTHLYQDMMNVDTLLGKIFSSLSTQESSSTGLQTQYHGQMANTHMQDNHTIASDNDRVKAAADFAPSAASCQNHTATTPMTSSGNHALAVKQTLTQLGAAASGNATGSVGQNGSLAAASKEFSNRMSTYCDPTELNVNGSGACKAAAGGTFTNADILPDKWLVYPTFPTSVPSSLTGTTPSAADAAAKYASYAVESIPPDPVRVSTATPSAQVQEEHMRRQEARARLEMARSILNDRVAERDVDTSSQRWLASAQTSTPGVTLVPSNPNGLSNYEAWQELMYDRFTTNNGAWFQYWDKADPSELQKQTVQLMAQMMMFNWKRYKDLEKMAAVQAEELATIVGIEEKKVDRHVQ